MVDRSFLECGLHLKEVFVLGVVCALDKVCIL